MKHLEVKNFTVDANIGDCMQKSFINTGRLSRELLRYAGDFKPGYAIVDRLQNSLFQQKFPPPVLRILPARKKTFMQMFSFMHNTLTFAVL